MNIQNEVLNYEKNINLQNEEDMEFTDVDIDFAIKESKTKSWSLPEQEATERSRRNKLDRLPDIPTERESDLESAETPSEKPGWRR